MPAQKLEVPNLSLSCLLQELKPSLEDAYVEKVQDMPNNWLKLRLKAGKATSDLIFSPNAFFLAEYRVNARTQSSGFGAFVKKRLLGKKLLRVEQLGAERIVKFSFKEFSLVAELFAKGNLLLLDSHGKILRPFKRESWSARTLAAGEPYALPPERGANPASLTQKQLEKVLKEGKPDVVRALIGGVSIPPVLAEEACARAGIEKPAPAGALKPAEVKKLHSEIKKLYSGVPADAGVPVKGKPCLAAHSNARVLLPFEPENKIEVLERYGSLNSALNRLVLLPFLKPAEAESREKQGLERTLEGQRAALEKSECSSAESKRKAELIYSHYPGLMEGVVELRKAAGDKKQVMYKKVFGSAAIKEVDFKKKRAVFEVSEG